MDGLDDLYQDMILDHSKRPRNFQELEGATQEAKGHNPLCGDRVTVYLEMEGDRVSNATFLGAGCAISTASASIMTEVLKGKTAKEVETLFEQFHSLITEGQVDGDPDLGKLAVFGGVSEFPIRVKCASLAWHTMKAALGENQNPVSTE